MNEQALAQALATALAPLLQVGRKQSTSYTATQLHGPGGLFGLAGLDNQVLSTRITPEGLSAHLPAFPSVNTNPLYPVVTGFEEDSSVSEPTTTCGTCKSGETEACIQTAVFGKICRQTKTLEPSTVVERVNRGEVDLQLINDILGAGGVGTLFSSLQSYDRNTIMQVATAWAMLEIGILFQNSLVPMVWQGNPANNIGSGYAEFPGLDILIGTNKVDAVTGTECGGLDSDVKDFNYQAITTTDAAGNFTIVRLMEYLEAYLYHNASRQHLRPATWAIVMRPELWYELTNFWPIAYLTTRNVTMPTGTQLNIDGARVRDMLDDIREGMYLFLNGRRHPVILDDGIYEYDSTNSAELAAGEFASNIYIVPLTYLGGRNATFFEHKDYRGARRDLNVARMGDDIWSDDGRFLWTSDKVKICYDVTGYVEPRIILKTPQLAGRLDHVKYTPAQHFRSPWEDSDYFFKGGVSMRTATEYYSDWNLPQ